MRAQSSHILFDYYVRPYSMSLADYFVRASKLQTHSEGIVGVFSSIQEVELQYLVHQLQLSDGAPGTFASTLAASSSPNHMSLLTIYFLDKVDECGTFVEIRDMVDGVVPHNEYIDEILVIGISQIDRIVQPTLALLFDLFKVSTIKVVEEVQSVPALKLSKDVIVVYDLFKGTIGPVEEASYFVDPTLSFKVLLGFISHSDNVYNSSFINLSIFEYVCLL